MRHAGPATALPMSLAGPAAAKTSNAVVIDFDQGRLVLG